MSFCKDGRDTAAQVRPPAPPGAINIQMNGVKLLCCFGWRGLSPPAVWMLWGWSLNRHIISSSAVLNESDSVCVQDRISQLVSGKLQTATKPKRCMCAHPVSTGSNGYDLITGRHLFAVYGSVSGKYLNCIVRKENMSFVCCKSSNMAASLSRLLQPAAQSDVCGSSC